MLVEEKFIRLIILKSFCMTIKPEKKIVDLDEVVFNSY